MTLEQIQNYIPGQGCLCGAYSSSECGCPVDWSPKIQKKVECWRDMPDSEMRQRCGELTAQEIRTVRAVLNNILPGIDYISLVEDMAETRAGIQAAVDEQTEKVTFKQAAAQVARSKH